MDKIGRYLIIEEIGRGGMATVYRAKDPNFDREVAIKILPRAFLHDPQFRARFEREAKTVAALEHQSIVPVYDFGEEDGQPYIVMRLMTGGSLNDKLDKGPLSLEEALEITARIADALDAAHAKGVIHRDLKPGNILFDQYGKAYLTDFGIARVVEGGATLTGGAILGTPAYMSPEQIQGDKEIDHRSDIYALGIIFYHMLTGNPPYQATTPAKVMMMHVLEPIPEIHKALPDLPPFVEEVLRKALSKDPDDRYNTAQDFVNALTIAIKGDQETLAKLNETLVAQRQSSTQAQTIASMPPLQKERLVAQPSEKKRRTPWLLIGIVSLASIGLIAGLGVIYLLFNNTNLFSGQPSPSPLPPTFTATMIPTPTKLAPIVNPPSETIPPSPTLPPATPTATALPPTETPLPSPTPTQEQPAALVVGGSDKIAFLNENDLWIMNIDGSELTRLTNDGAVKTNLAWTPDGSAVTYTSGKCAWQVDIESGRIDFFTCFETGELKDFQISPDGSQVAISLNNELFVVPFDAEKLSNARYHTDLRAMNECPVLNPLTTNTGASVPVKKVRWSKDGKQLALLIIANDAGRQVDLIRVIDISNCNNPPDRIDEFPATRFKLPDYDNTPYIQNFGWDGNVLFALNSYTRNDGFGHLYIYNMDLHKAEPKINPIDGNCCYRDAQFSPDGRYIIFAYQPFEAGATASLYYVQLGTLGTGAKYEPIPLPEDFFKNPKDKPQPVLRPAQQP